jgi:hypothetical protein
MGIFFLVHLTSVKDKSTQYYLVIFFKRLEGNGMILYFIT